MIATFAFKSRTKFSVQFVWDLSTTFRDLNAVTVQLKTGKCLKVKEWLSGLQMPGDIYVQLAPQDVWREYARAVAHRTRLALPEVS